MEIDEAAEIAYGITGSPWTAYCHRCERTYYREDLKEEVEPHGEVTLLCPKGHPELE